MIECIVIGVCVVILLVSWALIAISASRKYNFMDQTEDNYE